MQLSMVSPVYNEEKVIVDFVERATAVLAGLSDAFELILVNDHSTDDTLSLLQHLKARYPQLRVVNLSRNVGQQAATLIGLQLAKGDLVFLLDSDLQIHPEDMVILYNAANSLKNWDVISGARTSRSGKLFRSMSSRLVTWLINRLARSHLDDPASTFLLIRRDVLQKAYKNDVLALNFSMLLGFMGFKIHQVAIDFHPNLSRKSSYDLQKLLETLLLAVLNYSSGRKTIIYLMLLGLLLIATGSLLTAGLVVSGMVYQETLRTNLLIFYMFLAIIGIQFIFLGTIAYKIESTNRNLGFRQTMNCICDE